MDVDAHRDYNDQDMMDSTDGDYNQSNDDVYVIRSIEKIERSERKIHITVDWAPSCGGTFSVSFPFGIYLFLIQNLTSRNIPVRAHPYFVSVGQEAQTYDPERRRSDRSKCID